MKLTTIGALAFIAVTGLAACDDEPEDNGTVNQVAAEQTATTAFSATQTAITGDGQSGAFAMLGVGTGALALVTPTDGSQPMGAGSQGLGSGSFPQGTEGCTCTDSGCTFDGCDSGSGLLISGSLSWTDTSLDCDYTVSGNQAGATYSFSIFCDLDYTETSLAGQLNTSGDIDVAAAGAQGSSSWDAQMTFNNVTYASGQPTGGSIDLSASVTTGGETYTANQSVSF